MRILLYTGKGGVGKTSIAAATGIKLAKEGKKVLVMSTDQAHSLADALKAELGFAPTEIIENLYAMEIDVVHESEQAWGEMQGFMKSMITSRAQDGLEVEELLVFPGLEELFALFKILEIYEANAYDVLIVDCAPTGETLSLLKFPEVFGNMVETVLPMKRKMVKVAGPLIQKVTKIPMPKDSLFEEFEVLFDKLERLQQLMLNKDVLSLRLVTTPEKIVIKETKRNFTCLHLYDYNVDAIIINKVYPEEALAGYFNKWVALQADGLREIEESFSEIPIFKLMLQRHELNGIDVLDAVSSFYGDSRPEAIFTRQKIFTIVKDGESQRMDIHLPFTEKEELDIGQNGGELQIAIRNEKRCFALPAQLLGKDIVSAKLENGVLAIYFS
ncbi:MAG TPA: arsenic-transporting ATPase [Clostridiales bacterium UBA8960]|nr:arsenic-transporting ATPase [Clostridiales bacterium UBA8960]